MFKEEDLVFRILHGIVPTGVVFLLLGLAVMIGWNWFVSEIFLSAVELGVLPASLTILQAIKLVLLLFIFSVPSAVLVVKLDEFCLKSLFFVITIVITGLLIFILWSWIILDVFSGAVAYNLVPSEISFKNSIAVATLCAVFGRIFRIF